MLKKQLRAINGLFTNGLLAMIRQVRLGPAKAPSIAAPSLASPGQTNLGVLSRNTLSTPTSTTAAARQVRLGPTNPAGCRREAPTQRNACLWLLCFHPDQVRKVPIAETSRRQSASKRAAVSQFYACLAVSSKGPGQIRRSQDPWEGCFCVHQGAKLRDRIALPNSMAPNESSPRVPTGNQPK